ncbi:MAG: SGNH/GDSL hydrolase family protein [Rhodospirillales bacterium]
MTRRTTTTTLLTLALALGAHAVRADTLPPTCTVPDEMVATDRALPRMAAALSRPGPVTVLFEGTSSTAGGGASSPDKAFPARFGQELARHFPNVEIVVRAHRGRTAEDMVADIKTEVAARTPALVVWQTGTTDAVRNVELDSFGDALEHGISYLHARDADVVLVDPQYSPRMGALVDVGPYQDFMEQIAERAEVILFHRFDIMQHWIDSGQLSFDNRARAAQLKAAEQVHDCIGRLLARLVAGAIDAARAKKP